MSRIVDKLEQAERSKLLTETEELRVRIESERGAGEALLRRFAPLRLLGVSAALCAVSWFAFLSAESAGAASFWLFATGAFAALQYPIAKAQAYRALPGRSGAVNASALRTSVLLTMVR